MRITMVVPSLAAGGAERAVQRLTAGFLRRGHHVCVVTTNPAPDFYELPGAAGRIRLWLTGSRPGEGGRPQNLLKTMGFLARTLPAYWRTLSATRPDIVIAQLEQIGILTLLRPRLGWPVVVVEQNDARMNPIGMIWRILRRLTYRRAAYVVSVSAGIDGFFGWIPASKRRIIHNPVELADVSAVGEPPPDIPVGPYVIAMGRLTRQKGFDLLLEACAKVLPRAPHWRLAILGEGPDRHALEERATRVGLADRVLFLGTRRDPRPYLAGAAIFVLSSRWEGFPMALLEAMSVGTPSVSFDCPSGPSEIITHDEDGLLLPPEDVAGMSVALTELIEDDTKRVRLGRAASQSVARFGVEAVVARWEDQVFLELS